MPFDYPVVQYVMLSSIIAPHIVNLVILVRAKGISEGVIITIQAGLGAHELSSEDDIPLFD